MPYENLVIRHPLSEEMPSAPPGSDLLTILLSKQARLTDGINASRIHDTCTASLLWANA
jgi:hypothetical protein